MELSNVSNLCIQLAQLNEAELAITKEYSSIYPKIQKIGIVRDMIKQDRIRILQLIQNAVGG